MSDRKCTNCEKPQSELPNPLKVCAKCHTQAYCSRDCQKAHWKIHKRDCGRVPSAPTPGSLTNPPKEEVLSGARETITLMKALSKCNGFNYVLRDINRRHANLMNVADFAQRTFREFWFPLLPQQEATDLMLSCAEFFGKNEEVERRELAGKMAELERDHPEALESLKEWPERVDSEKYGDATTRNFTVAKIILDPSMQAGMGGKYQYPDEVKTLARRILGEGDDVE